MSMILSEVYMATPEAKALYAQFASAALTGLLAASTFSAHHTDAMQVKRAELAFEYADEMMTVMAGLFVLDPERAT